MYLVGSRKIEIHFVQLYEYEYEWFKNVKWKNSRHAYYMIMDIHFMMDEGKWKSKMLVMSNLWMNGGLRNDCVLMGVQCTGLAAPKWRMKLIQVESRSTYHITHAKESGSRLYCKSGKEMAHRYLRMNNNNGHFVDLSNYFRRDGIHHYHPFPFSVPVYYFQRHSHYISSLVTSNSSLYSEITTRHDTIIFVHLSFKYLLTFLHFHLFRYLHFPFVNYGHTKNMRPRLVVTSNVFFIWCAHICISKKGTNPYIYFTSFCWRPQIV